MSTKPTRLRIALVSPPWYSLPPDGYGGIEEMCAALADGLVSRGHDVITIGAGPRGTSAKHITTYAVPPSERIGDRWPDVVHAAQAARILTGLDVDMVHDHCLAGPLTAASRAVPTIVTTHYKTIAEPSQYYEAIAHDVKLVAISDAQQHNLPHLPWFGTVHNAIDVGSIPFSSSRGDYALWLGRMNPEKGPVEAIDVARRAGMRLVMAGRCHQDHDNEQEYFDEAVRPKLGPDVEWIGEVHGADKWKLLKEAACLLFPIQWDEPFGMVMIEAMATGTPVIGLNRGSVPEVIDHTMTGFICYDLDGMVAAIGKLDTIDPTRCRQHVRDNFDISIMTAKYEKLYQAAVGSSRAMRSQASIAPRRVFRPAPDKEAHTPAISRIPRTTLPAAGTVQGKRRDPTKRP